MSDMRRFPTIRDMRDCLSKLIEEGFGDLAVQILVVPDATLQAIALQGGGDSTKPALMIDVALDEATGRLPPSLISADRLSGKGMETVATQ